MTQIQFTGTREEFLEKARGMMTEEDIFVSPLEWFVVDETWERAQTLFGLTYDATEKGWYGTMSRFEECPNLHESKAGAQSDFDRRVRTALQTLHKAKTPD